MALKRRTKVDPSFSMSSMTDIVFLLLVFFMVTSTLIHPNALKLLLPRSNSQTSAKAITTVSITKELNYYIETNQVPLEDIEGILQSRLNGQEEPTIALHVDKSVPMENVVNIMNIAQSNKYKLILATQPLK
ncbi:Biopolymer transport protein ExbD/TolR [anaerobic digester metagenome]|jgi:biopolymer transport protein ExbD|nr:biopolymer transporter ExbD [Tenuifilaceae bacterium]